MDERFQFEFGRGLVPDDTDRIERKLAREYHTGRPQPKKLGRGEIVDDPRLRRDMDRQRGDDPTGKHQNTHIRHDQRVHSGLLRHPQKFGKLFGLLVGREGIAGEIHPRPAFVCIGASGFQSVRVEVGRSGTHTELCAAKVNRIRSIADRGFQTFPVTRRGEQLWHLQNRIPLFHAVFTPPAHRCPRRCRVPCRSAPQPQHSGRARRGWMHSNSCPPHR